MRLMFDQGVPQDVADIFVSRGHEVVYSRDLLQPDSPDPLIAITAAIEGWIVVVKDNDYKRFNDLFPQGFRTQARKTTGRIVLVVDEAKAAARVAEVIDLIEAHHASAIRRGVRLLLSISATGFSVTDNARMP